MPGAQGNAGDTYAYDGRHFTIPEIRLSPRPVQTPRPPILVAAGLVPPGTSRHITSSKGYTARRSLQRGDPRQLDLFMKEIRPHLRPREERATARP